MINAIGGKEKIRLELRLRLGDLEKRVKHYSKLLLPGLNIKINKENQGELNPRTFSQRLNFGVIFENF